MSELGTGGGSGYPAEVDTATTEVNSPSINKTIVDANNINDITAAIIAIQTELGVNPAGTLTTVLARLDTEHSTDGTHSDITPDSIVMGGKLDTIQAAEIASATTPDVFAVAGLSVHMTGTTTVTGFVSAAAGVIRIVEFDDILILTHNATTFDLPGSADITTAAGDIAIFQSEGGSNTKCVVFTKQSGSALSASIHQHIFTSDGTYTVPEGITSVRYQAWGGGGGGGGGQVTTNAGGGGGGGGYADKIDTVVAAATVAIVIGIAGTGGAVNVNGVAGGDTSIGSTTVVASGGALGVRGNIGGAGGAGGATSDSGIDFSAYASSGTTGGTNSGATPGQGGDSGWMQGDTIAQASGGAGVKLGQGGAGGAVNGTGGAGKQGMVIVTAINHN